MSIFPNIEGEFYENQSFYIGNRIEPLRSGTHVGPTEESRCESFGSALCGRVFEASTRKTLTKKAASDAVRFGSMKRFFEMGINIKGDSHEKNSVDSIGGFFDAVWSNLGATVRGREKRFLDAGHDAADDETKTKR